MREYTTLKYDGSEEKTQLSINKKIEIFIQSIGETLIARIFSLSYPISLYFLYNNNKLFTFYITLGIIVLSIIYFIYYYNDNLKRYESKRPSIITFYGKQILYCVLGYLVQFNLMFFDLYEPEGENIKINYIFCILKIFMIVEMIKRVYFYIVGSFLLFVMEIGKKGDRSFYVMTFEIVYYYLWYNYYKNTLLLGFNLSIIFHILGLIFSLLNGIFALGINFWIFKKCLIFQNLVYIFAQLYSIYWRKRESY